MVCPEGHVWVETFNPNHSLFGRCPVCRTTENTGKVLKRIDDEDDD